MIENGFYHIPPILYKEIFTLAPLIGFSRFGCGSRGIELVHWGGIRCIDILEEKDKL
jgi:hypothetical protein